MAFNFDVDTQDILERRRSLTGADLGLGGSAAQPGNRIRPLNMQDIVSIRDQMEPQEIQLAGFDPVQVSSAQYDFIVNHLAGIKDKAEMEAEEIRIASALSYSRNLGLPFQYTLQNLDQIALEWNGIKYSPTATNFRSITDSFKLGTLRNERGTLGTMAMNASTPEELSQILAQSSQLSQQMQALQDSVPRPWYIDLLKMGAENIPYMAAPTMEGIEGYATARLGLEAAARMGGMAVTNGPLRQLGEIGLQATKIGGRLNLPLATALTAYSIYRNFQRGKEINQGNLFLDLLEAGVPADTARPIAGTAGSINQVIEMIGGVDASWLKAAGIDVDTVASRLLSRMVIRGRLAELGTFAARWGAEAFTEGTEEVFQGIVEGIASDYAYALSGIRNPDAENQESWIKEAADNFAGGFAVSLLLGLPAVAISTHADFQTVKDLRNLSLTVRSKESYDELAAAMRPEDINEADWKTVTDTQFERGKQEGFNAFRDTISQQDLDTTLVDLDPDAEVQSDDEVTGDGQQKVTVDRLSNGKLYGHESRTRWRLPGSFGSGHTFNYGSPETRKSYGEISYTTDSDGHLMITNVRTRAGYENLRQEMVSDFISRFPDMDITWETNSVEETSIRGNLINANPRGADYGLNYGRSANAADIQNVRTRIGTLFSEDEATNSALAEIVEMVADREGLTGSEWLNRHIPEFRKWTAEEQAEADAGLPEGYHRTGASEFYDLVDGVKAVVYAGEYANPTTFLHEMTHVLRRIGDNGNEFRTLFNKVRNDADFQSFVNNSRTIKHKDLSTLFTTDEWTAADDEFFAELGEAYWMSGQTMNNELSGFFSRLTRMFRQIYRALKGTGRLNDEVVSYYDKLYGAGTAENRGMSTAAPTAEEAVTKTSDVSVASEGSEIADTTASADGTATPTADELRKAANEALDDSADPVITAEQDPDPATTYTMNASYAVSEWNAAMFRNAFRQKVSNETVRNILDSIPIALHRMAGLVRISAGSSITPNDQYVLSPRYENMTEEDAAKMQQNADEYAAAAQKHSERQREIIADGTVALTYTVNGKTYHMNNAAVDGLGMFTPVEYIEEAGLQDNPVRFSINADNVRVEGLEQPDPNILWNDIPDRTPIIEEEEFNEEYDPYESGLDEDGNPLYQTIEDYNPQKIGHGYKLFEQDTRTGKLYPLFIGAKEETPVGTWMVAQNIPTKGFANRPGWHIGSSLPDAPWLKGYSADNPRGVFNSKRGKNFRRVWAEVSYPMDVDYQEELDRRGIKDIKDHTPENGYYTFREANGTWIIAGALRVDRILTEEERQQIFDEAGYDEQQAWENAPSYSSRRRQYEARIAREENAQLFQTAEDITSSQEWQETEIRLRANAANFDVAGRPLAPNGQLSKLPYREWVTVRTPSFMTWFGDWMNDPENASKIVDDNGEPLVVYHGTASEFSVFDRNYLGSSTEAKSARIGFFFTNNQRTAEGYGNYASGNEARQLYKRVLELEKQGRWEEVNQLELRVEELALQKSNGIVMPAFLNIRNPYVVDADGASFKETGKIFSEFEPDKYDGMTVYSLNDNIDDDYVADHYIALRPNQIKSINNRGTFDNSDPNIYYQTQAEKKRIDDEYFAALDRGDIATAQKIVNTQALINGYSIGSDYQGAGTWVAPSNQYDSDEERRTNGLDDGADFNLEDMALGYSLVDDDVIEMWARRGERNMMLSAMKMLNIMDTIRRTGKVPEVTVYRAVPNDIKEGSLRLGDWVTLNRDYAVLHGQHRFGFNAYRIIEQKVPANTLYWDGNDPNEFGFDDGKEYAYRNTKNNRKLIDAVVRDTDGNIVPPSQRFNYRKWETFFQTMTDEAQDAYVEAAQTFAIENHEALFQTMDFGDSEELRGYFAQMIKEAANYTDYDEFHAVAEWIYPDDEMVERAWRVAKNLDEGSDNTGAMPKKTLARPDLSASSEDAKDAEFIEIISTDEGFNEWLNAIMQACRDVDSENTRAVYEAVDREEVAPLIRNLVFPRRRWVGVRRGGYDFAARDEKTHAKAIASAKGILRANPSFYRDLYARATETDFWISTYGDRIPQDIIDEAPEEFASLSASGRQKLAERIRNERLRRSILAGSEKYDPSQVKSLIKQQDDAIASEQTEVRRLEDELKKLGKKYGDSQSVRFKLWNQVAEKDAEITAAQERLTDISNRIAAHSRRDFGDDGAISQRLVDQQQKLASQISELVKQQDSYLRQLKNEAVSDAVRAQYDKDLARIREIRQDRDDKLKALRERYKERDALRAVNRHKEELAEIIMREPSKGVDLEEADKIRAIQALLDPAFRRGMRVNGETWDIKTLKAMFRGETERDPVVFGALTEDQLTRLSKKDLNEWTLEELEEMATAVKALREQGLRRRQLKVAAERARIQRYRDAAMSTIVGSGNYKEPPISGSTEQREEDRSLRNRMRRIYNSTINWARKSQILDGTSNHNPNRGRLYNATIGRGSTGHKGVFYDLLVGMKRDAEAEEFRMMTERMRPVREYISSHRISEDRFYEKFQIDIDGRKQTYRYSDLIYIYLSQNNPRNRDAVAYGEFVSQYEKDTIKRDVEDEIIGAGRKENAARSEEINNRIREIGDARYESVLRQAESIIKDESRRDLFEVVRLIEADFNSGLFDRLRRAMAETYNIRVEKEAYYLPINRTDFAGSEPGEVLKQDLMNMIPDNGSVQRGFTKDRQDISPYGQKPINIDFFNVWQQSVYNQEHALSHIDYVRLLKGVFQNKGAETLQAVISSSYGQTMVQSIKDHINQIANPQSFTKKSGGDSLLRFLRGSLYSSYLGFKASSVVLQAITSPAPYLGAVNPLELAQGYFTVLRNPIQMWEEIQRLSPFMATRSYHPIIEWMKTEAQRGDLSKVRRTVMRIEDAGMTGLELVDRYAVAGGWWAIYTKERNRLLNEGNLQTEAEIEKAAAKVADEFVQETQPQSNITELSPMFQNRNEAMAILTQFQASLNVVWQNVTYDVPQAIKNGQYSKAIGMITGYVVAGALLYMVQQGFDDDDDNGEKMRKLLYGMTTQITSGVPLVSDLVDNTVEIAITGETDNFFSSSAFPAFDKLMKAMQNTAKQNYGKAMENLTDSMLLFTGFPYSGGKEALRLFGIGDEDGKLGFYPGEIVGRRHE